MAWFLLPKVAWPFNIKDGTFNLAQLLADGYTPIPESQVQAAIDAYNAQQPYVPPADPFPVYLTDQEWADKVKDPATIVGAAGRAASRSAAAGENLVRGRGAVCFTWDDNYVEWLTAVLPLANQYGQRHTFCIRTDQLNQTGRLTSANIAAIAAAGHEIASHSVNHLDMTTLTVPQAVAEYDDSRAALEAISGVGKVTTFVYPFGANNGARRSEAYGRYDRIVFASGHAMYPYQDAFASAGYIGRRPWTNLNTADIQALIRLAAVAPVRIVIMGHQPSGPDTPTIAEIAATLQLARDLGVPCIPLREAFSSSELIPNSGFEQGMGGWEKTLTGTGAAAVVTDTPDVGLTGTKSMKLSTADATSSALVQAICPMTPGVGGTWAIQGRVRTDVRATGAGSVQLEIEQRDNWGNIVGTTATTAITATAGWTKVSATFTPDSKAQWCYVRPKLVNINADAWFDHLWLGPANNASG